MKNDFYNSWEWCRIRYETLKEQGAICALCKREPRHGAIMQVDHVKPRSKFPELELDKSNLQVLCLECNKGKSNRFEDDFRKKKPYINQRRDGVKSSSLKKRLASIRLSSYLKRSIKESEASGDSIRVAELLSSYLRLQRKLKKISEEISKMSESEIFIDTLKFEAMLQKLPKHD
jgi:HNH endonuclease